MNKYDPKIVESKWQKFWEENKTFGVTEDKNKEKFYGLIEFPYPSGAGLHVGHPRSYTAMDVITRKKRMEGKNVLFPIGFDSFGLPTENFAIKTGRPPQEITDENITTFTRQLKSLGFGFDWDRAVTTSEPEYYKWTQWIFLQLFKHGLAYKANQPINWCPKDKIGLANEEVVDGCCERCGTAVEKRNKEQWMLAITKYADKLLEGLNEVDYIARAKVQQENWIGKSEGAEINFKLNVPGQEPGKHNVTVFTTRPDTIFGATFLAISAELAQKWIDVGWQASDEVKKYIDETLQNRTTAVAREELEKTGVATNVTAVNPASGEEIPVWIVNYVMGDYGTGAIMAVPAHDERDWEFAQKYDLLIKEVVIKQLGERVHGSEVRNTARGICVRDGKLLITYDKKMGEYVLVGGGIDEGENSEETLLREIKEEIGYVNVRIKKYLGTVEHNYFHHKHKRYRHALSSGFVFELKNDETIARKEEEIQRTDILWLPIAEAIEKFKNSPSFCREVEFIERYLQKKGLPFTESGIAINSDFLNELPTPEVKEKIIQFLEEKGIGKRKITYKLRDWVFSRQRYWGEPIPLVFCEACKNKKYNFILIHGYTSNSTRGFKPWLKKELEKLGHTVWNPNLPNTDTPNVNEQAEFILNNAPFSIDENTILIGHSLGGPVVYRMLEKTNEKIAKVILVDPVYKPEFPDEPRPAVEESCDWIFDWKKISSAVGECIILGDSSGKTIKHEHLRELSRVIDGQFIIVTPTYPHFSSNDGEVTEEPAILQACLNSGWVPLSVDQLPLTLPKVEKYLPTDTGESPLAPITDWVNTECPKCGNPARRETDTMPNWAGSSWYWLRYADPKNDHEFASPEKLNYWTPVDWYNGGMEHTVLHLLYSRFWNQFLYDIGVVPTREPYKKRTSHGMILAKGGEKMSKSKGNVVNPDEMIDEYGADALRAYIMFMGPFDQAVEWDTNGLIGVRRFLDRVWNLQQKLKFQNSNLKTETQNLRLQTILHQTIKKISDDVESMRFNTAIAKLMELSNQMSKEEHINVADYQTFIKLLAPFAPHIAEELWIATAGEGSVAYAAWPQYDSELAKESLITVVAQVNGKVRDEFVVSPEISEEEIKQLAFSSEKVQKWLEGREPKKIIYVKGKLVSIVV